MLVGRQGTGSRKVHLAGAVPPLWVFSCLCHFPQSSPAFPVPPDTASLGMKLSKSGCSLAGASAPRCPRAVGSRQPPGPHLPCWAGEQQQTPSAARVLPQLLGPPSALPLCSPRFPSRGKQDTSGGGGERSVPPAHPDTEVTNTNMPICTGAPLGPTLYVQPLC